MTQQGMENGNVSTEALKLMTGTYFLIPKSHENDVSTGMDKLTALGAYLVPKDAPPSMTKDAMVVAAVPSVSYVSLTVKVQSISAFKMTS